MPNSYNKLIRDRIPEIIRRNGHVCELEIMSAEEYGQALREKLIEEAMEAASASGYDLLTELADLYEVMNALMKINHIDFAQVRTIQEQRRAERGGFEQRIRLLRTMVSE